MTNGYGLTERELEILQLVADGVTYDKGIATRLRISDEVVHSHLTNIYSKMELRHIPGYHSRIKAVTRALIEGLIYE